MSILLAIYQVAFLLTQKYQRRELRQVLYPEDIEYDLFDSYQAFVNECYYDHDPTDLEPDWCSYDFDHNC